jgi:hypothetical protein
MTSKLSNGRYAAIFLTLSLSSCFVLAQSSIRFSAESASNRGVLTTDYWKSEKIDALPAHVIGYSDVSMRGSWEYKEQSLFVERRRTQTYVGGANALMLAAADNLDTKSQTSGQYPITAKLKQFEWDALGLTLKGQSDSYQGVRWQLEPKLAKLRQFKTGTGEGALTVAPDNSSLNGTIHRESSSSYGYLINSRPLDMGYGASADASVMFDLQQAFSLTLDVKNIWSRFKVPGAYVNDRSYQVVQSAGEIKFSQTPSISGIYGQQGNVYRVPTIYKLGLSNNAPFSYGGGVIGFEGQHMSWAHVGYQTGLNHFDLTTYAFDNLAVSYRRDDLFIKGMSVGVVFLSGLSGKPTLQLQTVIYNF